MDPTKAPCGCLTTVYRDYDFLQRWVNYYSTQFDRQHLYIISQGNDPQHREIARGCNVIGIPRDGSLYRHERRMGNILSNFCAGLLRYYNWMIVGGVDEIVVLDPEQGESVESYLHQYETGAPGMEGGVPETLTPFGIELLPQAPVAAGDRHADEPVLQHQHRFRIDPILSKPCLVRKQVKSFEAASEPSHEAGFMDPHLYLLHLRYCDEALFIARLKARDSEPRAADEEIEFKKITEMLQVPPQGKVLEGDADLNVLREDAENRGVYCLPARFSGLY